VGKKDKRIDAYIARSADFAKPILKHLRDLLHEGCPDCVETIKWSMCSFDYKGPFVSMAAFKEHAVLGFWKAELIKDPKHYLQPRSKQGGEAMGHMGRITSMKDLPPDRVMLDFIRQARKLNDERVKLPAKPKKEKKALKVPGYFLKELKRDKKVMENFTAFSPSHKAEYIEWITEAKTDATREKRMATALEWIGEGKPRNWKYMRSW
jgi:uncharacterized protein YdeI (YjbR/CyaY-like superfamily)